MELTYNDLIYAINNNISSDGVYSFYTTDAENNLFLWKAEDSKLYNYSIEAIQHEYDSDTIVEIMSNTNQMELVIVNEAVNSRIDDLLDEVEVELNDELDIVVLNKIQRHIQENLDSMEDINKKNKSMKM